MDIYRKKVPYEEISESLEDCLIFFHTDFFTVDIKFHCWFT